MEKRFSDYTYEELRQEVAQLTEKAQKAEQMGMVNEYAVHERKIIMAKSYMMNPKDFSGGETYKLDGDLEHDFYIVYMNGVFAWGYRQTKTGERVESEMIAGEEYEALPIAMLGEKLS
ncbi:YfhH family protein [Halobacillus locisalis]|uniref:YfhH family protein n=1 Tax=Halobacillus locisalis TaxID=220753 RepID=A0A838CXP7_9BACI|nr:YfhH family protein [Halobacillus locisalis]MBA2176545.1 YfhH family protein [Halobacillus locisalis]